MAPYVGDRIPLRADEVQEGHRLVHEEARPGWLAVEEVGRRGDWIVLHFADGSDESFQPDDVLWRVVS